MGSSATPTCSALFFIHKRSLKDLCIPTIQWETAQSGILLLHIILLIIPGGNLVLIINSTGREFILEREKRRKWMNEVMMFGLSLAFSPCRLVFKAGAPQNASGLFFMSASCQLTLNWPQAVPSHNLLPPPVIFTGITSIIDSMNCSYMRVWEWRRLTTERSSFNWH